MLKFPHPFSKEEGEMLMASYIKKSKESPRLFYSLAIELKSERKVIGGVGLGTKDPDSKEWKIKYWVNESYQRKGYGAEFLDAILDFAFNKLKLKTISGQVYVENPSSGKLLEKLGFKNGGIKKQALICEADKKVHDVFNYSLSEEEYKK
jgi:ribosomal-protein-alanine N-acetyltransferase